MRKTFLMNPIDKNKHYLPVDLLKDRVYIDIEATKTLVPLEVSLIDYKGEVMFSSLIRPDDTFLKNVISIGPKTSPNNFPNKDIELSIRALSAANPRARGRFCFIN